MKTTLVLTCALLGSLWAQADPDLPEPEAIPEENVPLHLVLPFEDPELEEDENGRVKAPGYLGVSGEGIGVELKLHLALEKGVGLSTVAPGSPADRVGLAEHDIITKVDGEAVGTMEELRVAIQEHGAGEKVDLEYIQKGKVVKKKVELSKRPGGGIRAQVQMLQVPQLPPLQGGGPQFQNMQNLQMQFQNLRLGGGGGLHFNFGGGGFKLNDADGSVEIERKKDSREVTVRDRHGRIEYEGPWDTPQDKAAVPPGMRKRIEAAGRLMGGNDVQLPMQFEFLPDLPPAMPRPGVLPEGFQLEVVPIEPALPAAPPDVAPPEEDGDE